MLGFRRKGALMPSKSFPPLPYSPALLGHFIGLVRREPDLIDRSVFEGSSITYPSRRVTHEDNGDAKMGSYVSSFIMIYIMTQYRLPPSLAAPRLPSSSNFRPPSAINAPVKRTKLR
jgi:hypothetical protein